MHQIWHTSFFISILLLKLLLFYHLYKTWFLLGRSVFAKKEFFQGQFLLEYVGEIVNGEEGEAREETNSTGFRYFFFHENKEYWWV